MTRKNKQQTASQDVEEAQAASSNIEIAADAEISDTKSLPTEENKSGSNKIMVLREYCVRHQGADCDRCEKACPKGTISYSATNLPVIDREACTRCGICLGICDAFSSTRVTMLDLHDRIRRIALQGDDVYFTCPENIFPGLEVAPNVIILPCLASLSPEFWSLLLAEKIPLKVACDFKYCRDCNRAGELAEDLYTHAINTAENWTESKVGFSRTIPEKQQVLKDIANPEGVDRRSAFTNLAGDVGDIASGKRRLRNSEVLQQFYDRREKSRALARLNLGEGESFNAFVPEGRTKKIMLPKQRLLLEAIEREPEIAQRINVVVSETNCEKCTNSLSCATDCPTGARFPDPDTGKLSMDVRYCIGCGICVESCPHQAVELIESTADIFIDESKDTDETCE